MCGWVGRLERVVVNTIMFVNTLVSNIQSRLTSARSISEAAGLSYSVSGNQIKGGGVKYTCGHCNRTKSNLRVFRTLRKKLDTQREKQTNNRNGIK